MVQYYQLLVFYIHPINQKRPKTGDSHTTFDEKQYD